MGGTISAATFAPPLPTGSGVRQAAERRIILWKLEKAKPRLTAMHYLATTGDEELWRISARVETFNDLDYGVFLDQLRSVVDPLIAAADRKLGEDVGAIVTGGIPTFYVVQRRLLDDLRAGFGVAFLTIVRVEPVYADLAVRMPDVGADRPGDVGRPVIVAGAVGQSSWIFLPRRYSRDQRRRISLAVTVPWNNRRACGRILGGADITPVEYARKPHPPLVQCRPGVE